MNKCTMPFHFLFSNETKKIKISTSISSRKHTSAVNYTSHNDIIFLFRFTLNKQFPFKYLNNFYSTVDNSFILILLIRLAL